MKAYITPMMTSEVFARMSILPCAGKWLAVITQLIIIITQMHHLSIGGAVLKVHMTRYSATMVIAAMPATTISVETATVQTSNFLWKQAVTKVN